MRDSNTEREADVSSGATAVLGVALVLLAAVGAVAAPAGATGASADVGAEASVAPIPNANADTAGVVNADAVGVASANAAPVDCSFPVTATDATGAEVTVPEEPERVVVIGPSTAQTMWAIGAQEKVVGMPVDYNTGYLNDTEGRVNVVTQFGQPIQENVVDAEPDLVLAPNIVDNETVEELRGNDLTVFRFDAATSLEDVYAKTELTGRLVGEFDSAAQVSAEMEGQVDAVRHAVNEPVASGPSPRVYYNLGGGWTAGPYTFIGDIIDTAGGANVAAGYLDAPYGELSPEVLLNEDPEWILNTQGLPLPDNQGISQSTAVQEDQIVTVDANFLNQPGPRNVQPLRKLAEALHPDAMADVDLSNAETPEPETCEGAATATDTATATDSSGDDDTTTATEASGDDTATATATETATATATETDVGGSDGTTADDAEETAEATDGDGPGFTAATGAVALLGAALFLRRRR